MKMINSRSVFSLRVFATFFPIYRLAPRLPISIAFLEDLGIAVDDQSQVSDFCSFEEPFDSSDCSASSYTPQLDSSKLASLCSPSQDAACLVSQADGCLPRVPVRYLEELPVGGTHFVAPQIFLLPTGLPVQNASPPLLSPSPHLQPHLGREARVLRRCQRWLATQCLTHTPGVATQSSTPTKEASFPEEGQLEGHTSTSQLTHPLKAGAGKVDCLRVMKGKRLSQLESDISELRKQLAELVLRQEHDQLFGRDGETAPGLNHRSVTVRGPEKAVKSQTSRFQGDGESDAEGCHPQGSPLKVMTIPPPPLLPPPPIPPLDWRGGLLAKKQTDGMNTLSTTPIKKSQPADMSQVLKELTSGAIKLRSVQRSPGGTPFRSQHSALNDPIKMDPSSLIASALKLKFANARFELDRTRSSESSWDEISPHFHPTSFIPPTNGKENMPDKAPLFGRHILRPVEASHLPTKLSNELKFWNA